MKNVGICIQIGLDFTVEMSYLLDSNWRKQMRRQVLDKRIPKSVSKGIAKWRVIGVDSDKESVDRMQEQYPDIEFVCKELKTGKDLEDLVEELKLDSIDALIMDIEGDEYNVLETYNGILPNFISVECHRWYHSETELLNMHGRNRLEPVLIGNHGMKLYRELMTNTQVEFPTVELQFIKQRLKDIEVHSDKLRLHLLGLPHTVTHPDFNACAFSMKMLRFNESLYNLGHEMYHYGNPGALVKGEHIDVVPKEVYEKNYGRNIADRNKVYEIAEHSEYAATYNMRMCGEVRLRARPGDIVLINYGAWCDYLVDMLSNVHKLIVCEMSVGYINSMFAPYRVFESYSNQEFHKGGWSKVWEQWNATNMERSAQRPALPQLDPTFDCVHNTSPQFMDDVIPMGLDPRQFDYREKKKNYYLYLGRIQWSKGIDLAVKTCEAMNEKLIVVGQCETTFEQEIGYPPPDCVELRGHADIEERKELMANAKGGFVCTYYPEPGGHVMGEYLLSGSPIITTDWGNMPNMNLNGYTGYRVRSAKEAEEAVRAINEGRIKSYYCRKWAMNFTMEKQARQYEYYFRRLRDHVLYGNGNDLYYEQSDVDLSIRTMIHPVDPNYDIDLKLCPPEDKKALDDSSIQPIRESKSD